MSGEKEGTRVIAVLRADREKVEVLGAGVYEGMHPRPGWEEGAREMLDDYRQTLVDVANEPIEDAVQKEKAMRDLLAKIGGDKALKFGMSVEESVRKVQEGALERSKLPDEELMEELSRGPGFSNPRIRLDSGKIVWGLECWWGEEEKIKRWIGDRTVVELDIEKVREADYQPVSS